jgi:hypothetical protein
VNYDDEHWIKVYTRDTAGWLAVSWQARGLALEIARKLPKKTGELSLGRRGLEALAGLLRAPWSEIEPFVQELIADGRLEYDAERQVIRDPGHVARQTAATSAAERKRRQRDVAAVGVTRRHAESRAVTPSHEEKRREEKREDPPNPLPRVASGTALATEVCAAYESAVSDQTGNAFALSGPGPRSDLMTVVNRHAPAHLPPRDVVVWIAAQVDEWLRQHRGRESFTGNWAPKHFLAWLNGGKKPPPMAQSTQPNGGASARARKELT